VKIHPKRVYGTFRTLKWWIMAATLGIYYVTPWLRWDRGPGVPDQAVLIDIPSRRFYFFFIEIWPQEVYYIAGLLIMAGIGLFLITSLVGRAWCGYMCPQTVWTDLFLVVERWIEGDRGQRPARPTVGVDGGGARAAEREKNGDCQGGGGQAFVLHLVYFTNDSSRMSASVNTETVLPFFTSKVKLFSAKPTET